MLGEGGVQKTLSKIKQPRVAGFFFAYPLLPYLRWRNNINNDANDTTFFDWYNRLSSATMTNKVHICISPMTLEVIFKAFKKDGGFTKFAFFYFLIAHQDNNFSFISLSSGITKLKIISLMGAHSSRVEQDHDGFYSSTDAYLIIRILTDRFRTRSKLGHQKNKHRLFLSHRIFQVVSGLRKWIEGRLISI